jgi:hypothetical protein
MLRLLGLLTKSETMGGDMLCMLANRHQINSMSPRLRASRAIYGANRSLSLVELEHSFRENLIQILREMLQSRHISDNAKLCLSFIIFEWHSKLKPI